MGLADGTTVIGVPLLEPLDAEGLDVDSWDSGPIRYESDGLW